MESSKVAYDGERAAHAHLALHELSSLLDELPVEQRVAVILKEIEGLSAAEIADLVGVTEGAIEQRLVRARQALRVKGGEYA